MAFIQKRASRITAHLLSALMALQLASPAWAQTYQVRVPANISPEALLPELTVTPAQIDFGEVAKASSAMANATLTNTGDRAAEIRFSSLALPFDFNHDCVNPLPSGQNCSLNFSFTPTETGAHTGALSVSGGKLPVAIELVGTGVGQKFGIIASGATRTWENGTIAASCSAYRTPSGNYAYAGATGDGRYRIQPPGHAAMDVHCDMTTDGGGWTLAAWSKGTGTLATMPKDFFVKSLNAGNLSNRTMANTASSANVEALSKALVTKDVMLVSGAYSASPIIEKNQGVWQYDTPDCSGALGHTGRMAGCENHHGNDNFDTLDRFNIAIYSSNQAIVPGWLHMGYEVCYSNKGWCDFEFYLR